MLFLSGILLPAGIFCQTHSVAILTPENNAVSDRLAALIAKHFKQPFNVLDRSMADAAFRSADVKEPFNQTVETAKTLAEVIGCEFFIVIKTADQRRAGIRRPDYFESNAAVFVIDGRTGELIFFKLFLREASTAECARKALEDRAAEIADNIASAAADSRPAPRRSDIALPPDPAPQTFRAPIPYKRIKPEYTEQAMIYDIEATVDVAVDIDADGTVLDTRIERWAGYGLDESVEQNIRRMNWRPAELNGKYLPMRILLRYNFKDIEDPK